MGESSLLARVTAAAHERHLSQNTLIAYRRTWQKLIAWSAAEGLALAALPLDRAGEFYEETTCGRSASHHLQVKAALALLYDVLDSTNPFAGCPAPKFAAEKVELRYHTASQLGQLLRELRQDRRSYFGHLTYHLATTLFFTGCRFHEWARQCRRGRRYCYQVRNYKDINSVTRARVTFHRCGYSLCSNLFSLFIGDVLMINTFEYTVCYRRA